MYADFVYRPPVTRQSVALSTAWSDSDREILREFRYKLSDPEFASVLSPNMSVAPPEPNPLWYQGSCLKEDLISRRIEGKLMQEVYIVVVPGRFCVKYKLLDGSAIFNRWETVGHLPSAIFPCPVLKEILFHVMVEEFQQNRLVDLRNALIDGSKKIVDEEFTRFWRLALQWRFLSEKNMQEFVGFIRQVLDQYKQDQEAMGHHEPLLRPTTISEEEELNTRV